VVFDASSFDADVEVVPHLILVITVKFAAEKCGVMVGLDRVNRGTSQASVDVLQVALTKKHNVGGILNLHQTPVVLDREMSNHRAEAPGKAVEPFVEGASVELVGESLPLSQSSMSEKALSIKVNLIAFPRIWTASRLLPLK